jgi:DNA polymerase-3 subunit chi
VSQPINPPQVLFHQFETKSGRDLLIYACRLIEKGYKQGTSLIYVHCNNKEEAKQFDALLWTFRQESFVPHNLITNKSDDPVKIGWEEQQATNVQAIVNLSNEIPDASKNSPKIHEIVENNEKKKKIAREKWKAYKSNGFIIKAHKAD